MRIDMDRICVLAGVKSKKSLNESSRRRSLMREGAGHDADAGSTYEGEGHGDETAGDDADESYMFEEDEGEEDESYMFEEDEGEGEEDEMVQVDERMLVQELRRARRLMNESRKRQQSKKQKLQEMQLKGIIDQEVKNVLKELQLNSGWIYGKNKPTRSRKGYTHQGSYLKGIGFK